MILDEKEVIERFESPLNLLNRLRAGLSHHKNQSKIVSIPPTAENLIEDLEEKLKYGGLKSKAAGIMNDCLEELKSRIGEVDKPTQLAAVAETMNKIISSEDKNKKSDSDSKPQYVIYTPTFISEEHFETIYVRE